MAQQNGNLVNQFGEPPFSVLNANSPRWHEKKREWLKLGINSELGRDTSVYKGTKSLEKFGVKIKTTQSVFDPYLSELMYSWFCPKKGFILDPFAGGSVRGIVAGYLGYQYVGIDIREEQVIANEQQAKNILPHHKRPSWLVGDSNQLIPTLNQQFDLVFSCPPYFNLERYSRLKHDISNMASYDDFLSIYTSIIRHSCDKLKTGGFAVFVVGEVRDKKGNYIGFVPDTIQAFEQCKMAYYNEMILATALCTAPLRARMMMRTNKVVKVHQNILVFKKP